MPWESLHEPAQPFLYCCISVWLNEWLMRQLDMYRRLTVHLSSAFFSWKIIFNSMYRCWDVSLV